MLAFEGSVTPSLGTEADFSRVSAVKDDRIEATFAHIFHVHFDHGAVR
jgi:hypothetical protein